MNNLSIYLSSHGPIASLNDGCFKSIQVGAEYNGFDYGFKLKDNIGDNISLKNPYYCELTAQYWAWKNDLDSKYIGFMHYRRHLNFGEQNLDIDVWGCANFDEISDDYQSKCKLEEDVILELLTSYDVILPEKWDVRHAGSKNNYEHYKNGQFLHINDYDAALDIIEEYYPDYMASAKEFNNSTFGYYTNIFVMPRSVFEHYSAWLFDILDKLEERVSIGGYCSQERRVIGHVAERLFNIYLLKMMDDGFTSIELQRTFISNINKTTVIEDCDDEWLNYVICFDENYAHSGAALISSIISNSTIDKKYRLNLFCDGVSKESIDKFRLMIHDIDNFDVRFIDTAALFNSDDMNVSEHFTAATYARLFIPKVFPNLDKVVFIDADMIVCSDVADLFSVNLNSKPIGAVKDIVTEGFVRHNRLAPNEFGGHNSYSYLKQYLGMNNPDNYFQAGLLVMDLSMIRQLGLTDVLIESIYKKKYWYHDQDILNRVFENNVEYLDLSWNVYHGNGDTDSFFPYLKLSTYIEYLQSRNKPRIIHYAGSEKPWLNVNVDFADLFFRHIMNTPWSSIVYKEIYKEVVPMPEYRTSSKIKNTIKKYLRIIAPIGTLRRKILQKLYVLVRRYL